MYHVTRPLVKNGDLHRKLKDILLCRLSKPKYAYKSYITVKLYFAYMFLETKCKFLVDRSVSSCFITRNSYT